MCVRASISTCVCRGLVESNDDETLRKEDWTWGRLGRTRLVTESLVCEVASTYAMTLCLVHG